MKIVKVTHGFVTQVFDATTGQFTEQNFTAGDIDEYETLSGQPAEPFDDYLPFDMVQPTPNELLQQCKYAALDLRWALSELNTTGDHSGQAWDTLKELDEMIKKHDPNWETVVDWE
jgi:hypothetical protein